MNSLINQPSEFWESMKQTHVTAQKGWKGSSIRLPTVENRGGAL